MHHAMVWYLTFNVAEEIQNVIKISRLIICGGKWFTPDYLVVFIV
jgi:hypothetical protein